MNAYQERQNPGIKWPDRTPLLPRQRSETPPRRTEPLQYSAQFDELEMQMGEFAAQHEATLNDVRKHYVLPADSSVLTFLTDHRSIPQILLGAVPALKACFGPHAVFDLRAPIDEAGSRTLYVVAVWPGKSQDVRDALTKFDNNWWLERAGHAAGYLTFTYELV